ncbi:regulatory protein, luxR family [Actinomadura mexicana]|uniref:Regulatory protein, luxR family n=2 Tax=Actinomadura mexicana TaxID=134959 RepID=A0A238XL72_9ACTN|nr:regulatory protein, luxR family [Actinomadura mexicana]
MDKLVERDEEEKTFVKVYGECAASGSRIIAISGSLASGKTALLRSFAQGGADAGATVLEATASSFERDHPLGVIDQMLRGRRLSSPGAEREIRALFEGVDEAAPRVDESGNLGQISLSTLNLLHTAFQHLASGQPLVVCVDDAHFTDIESLHYLLALMRRMGSAPIVFVLSFCPGMGRNSVQRVVQAEMLRMPNCVHMPLKPLSVTGVATILGEVIGIERAGRLAAYCRDISGGKPLLVHAFAEDCTVADDVPEPGGEPARHGSPVPGPVFGHAVLSCLYRSEPVVLELAQAIAVLGACGSPAVVARFCDMAPESVRQVVASAGLEGLLDCDFVGRPSVRKAVMSSIPPDERRAMHAHAAHLLRDEGAPALAMAEHLMLVEERIPWANKVLREAADQALVNGNREAAIGHLRKAHHACAGGREQADISAKLADIMRHHNPGAVKRYLPDLVAAIGNGHLDGQQSVQVITDLLWHGEVDQAAKVLALMRDRASSQATEHTHSCGDQLRLWLPLTYPGIAPVAGHGGADPVDVMAPARAPEHRAAAALGAVLRGTPAVDPVRTAETILQEAGAGVASPAASVASLVALIYSDRLDQASVWCDSLLACANDRQGLVWKAMYTSARAAVSYRLGDLAKAERQAREALALMPAESWGTALVVPLAFLVHSLTAMGRYKDAESYLKFPVPGAALETLGGLHYLSARGHFSLAAGRYEAALRDFLACGDRMRTWDVDCPAAVPWRTDAAQAYVCSGLVPQARELIAEQLALLPAGPSRTRGMTYRVQAATLDLAERRPVLLRAASVFESCGDSLGLAYALTDLSHACMALGDCGQAQLKARRARVLAEECCAAPLQGSLAAVRDDGAPAQGMGERRRSAPHLSRAELRVAELAASGSTNEQISRKLFITVSTVEQHLTRVYRKLAIRRRTELSSRLPELVR